METTAQMEGQTRSRNEMTKFSTLTSARIALAATTLLSGLASAAEPIDYNQDVRGILSDRCFHCHGPDGSGRKADLRLDLAETAYAPTEGDRAFIKPGAPDQSEVIRRIFSTDPDEKMPPPDSNLSLTEDERAVLHRWIEEGAAYETHWSFRSIAPPTPPSGSDFSHAIDRFVAHHLAEHDQTLNAPAPLEKQIRRLFFDLTGLPPTPEEVEAFLSEPTETAWENLVDELLARPSFGERMAMDWMDVARYADSYGYQVDNDNRVWPWRDWVINAFNSNLSYDQFITWQLAGDLLPDATDDQILATTFNRLHQQNVEGGSVPEEFRIEYVSDRVHTFGTAFLGLTLECARCHDHKYDPITQKEYYQFSSFFDNIDEAGLYSFFTPAVPTPTMFLQSDAEKQELTELAQVAASKEAELKALAESREEAFALWLNSPKEPLTALPGEIAAYPFEKRDGDKFANTIDGTKPATSSAENQTVPGKVGHGIQLTGDDPVTTPIGDFNRHEPFSVSLWIWTPDEKDRAVVFHRSRAWTDAASRGYQLLIEEGQLSGSLIHYWPGNALRVRTQAKVPVQTWTHVTFTYDGSSRAAGLRLYIDGKEAPCDVVRDQLTKHITGGGGDTITIGERMRDKGFKGGRVDELRVFNRELTPIEALDLAEGNVLSPLLIREPSALSEDERAHLRQFYLSSVDVPFHNQRIALQRARRAFTEAQDSREEIMVMKELPEPRPTHLLERGAYDAPGELVEATTPAVLPPFPKDAPQNRLGLAKWLTNPNHPLTSRVAVNRIWQLFFGRGLVGTTNDFGSQGELPLYQDLLDWLAANFMEAGWDTKRLIKQIVLSQTYRQDSFADASLLEEDPENRLLARGPRYRLPAEMIRDNALAASGLLVPKIGGESVRPYEVAVSFKPVEHGKGDQLYRRSLYTYWKRTGPAPVMMTLDAVKRDVCVVKRESTASPLQALVLLNDPQMTEAARILAETMILKHGDQIDPIAEEIFIRLTSRKPSERERFVLRQLYTEQHAYFDAHPDNAASFLETGEAPLNETLSKRDVAAITVMAITLLNHDECVVKR